MKPTNRLILCLGAPSTRCRAALDHTAYFWTHATIALMRQVLRGHDRTIVAAGSGITS